MTFILGEGEEVTIEVFGLLLKIKSKGILVGENLRELAQIKIYIPKFYDVENFP